MAASKTICRNPKQNHGAGTVFKSKIIEVFAVSLCLLLISAILLKTQARTHLEQCQAQLEHYTDQEKICDTKLGFAKQSRQVQEDRLASAVLAHNAAVELVDRHQSILEQVTEIEVDCRTNSRCADANVERKRIWLLEQQRRENLANKKLFANVAYASPAIDYIDNSHSDMCSTNSNANISKFLYCPPHGTREVAGRPVNGLKTECGCGTTALIAAARAGHALVIRAIVDLAETRCRPNTRGLDGVTALHAAAVGGHLSAVQILCSIASLDVNAGVVGRVPNHHLTCKSSAIDSQWDNVDSSSTFFCAPWTGDMTDFIGATALHLAVRFSHFEVVQCLCEQSTTPRTTRPYEGKAVEGSHSNLIPQGVDVNIRTDGGCSALYFAAVNGERAIVDLLLAVGAQQLPYSENIQTAMIHVTQSITTNASHAVTPLMLGTGMSRLADTMTEKMVAAFAADFDVLESLVASDQKCFYRGTAAVPSSASEHAAKSNRARAPFALTATADMSQGHKAVFTEKIAVQSILGHLYHITLNDALTIDSDNIGARTEGDAKLIQSQLDDMFQWCYDIRPGCSAQLQQRNEANGTNRDTGNLKWDKVETTDGSGGLVAYWTNGQSSTWEDPLATESQQQIHADVDKPIEGTHNSTLYANPDVPQSEQSGCTKGDFLEFELSRSDLESYLNERGFLAKFGPQYFPLFLEMQFMRSDRDCGGTIDRTEMRSRFRYGILCLLREQSNDKSSNFKSPHHAVNVPICIGYAFEM